MSSTNRVPIEDIPRFGESGEAAEDHYAKYAGCASQQPVCNTIRA
jgi:hypothetical protein